MEEMIKAIKETIGKVMIKSTENYIGGDEHAASKICAYPVSCEYHLVMYPGTCEIDVHKRQYDAPYCDLIGDRMATFSTDFFDIDQIAALIANLISTYEKV